MIPIEMLRTARGATTAVLLAVGLIQAIPLVAAVAANFDALYGLEVKGNDLEILMRNRAVYIGAVGALLAWSALRPHLRPAAIALSLATVGSYVALALYVGDYNDELGRLVWIDIANVVLLAGAAVAEFSARRRGAATDVSPGATRSGSQ
jgi:hypothetical protein